MDVPILYDLVILIIYPRIIPHESSIDHQEFAAKDYCTQWNCSPQKKMEK